MASGLSPEPDDDKVWRASAAHKYGSTLSGHECSRRTCTGTYAQLILLALASRSQGKAMSPLPADKSILPAFPGERPKAHDVKTWAEAAKASLTADERALVEGYSPRCLMYYTVDTVPAVLTVGKGISAANVATRELPSADACHQYTQGRTAQIRSGRIAQRPARTTACRCKAQCPASG